LNHAPLATPIVGDVIGGLPNPSVCLTAVPEMINALTVDVEDYFQVSGFERRVDRRDWPNYQSRVVANTQRLLAIYDRQNVKATFFVLGWVAERYPALLREISSGGHEVASHGYWHRLVYEQSPTEFREDLRRSQAAIGDAIGKCALAYRAPSFSITRRSLWAIEILLEEGFTVDSSVYPVYHDRYGIPDAPREPFYFMTPAGAILEFPASVYRLGRFNVPVSGGGYFRLTPYRMTEALLRSVNQRARRPFVFYIHPWETDPDQPRLAAGNRQARFRHYVNLSTTASKLERLLKQFAFGTLAESIDAHLSQVAELVQWNVQASESPDRLTTKYIAGGI
jgi:polysaccharide deacetylase family protein (PEP-CTERM system associated)